MVVQVLTTSSTTSTGTGAPVPSSTAADAPIIIATVPVPPAVIPFVVTPPPVTLISTGAGDHFGPVMSADGRFVTYDPDGAIFLYDRQSNTTITIAAPGAGFTFSEPTISSDGHYIVFQGSNGAQSFVFIYDNNPADALYQQTTELMPGSSPAISGDGSTIVVEQGGASIGVYDQQGHALATITPAAIGETGAVWKPAISADGHVIAFWNSDTATAGGSGQLFVYNLSTGTVSAIANTTTGAGTTAASVSADGHFVVYQSDASDGHSEIFLYDLTTGHVVFQTANASGASYSPVISPDGHFIIFASDAQLTPDDTNSVADTYVVDVTDPSHPVFKLVSALADGTQGNAASNLGASISAGGLFVAFGSSASNLSSGAAGTGNIFVVDPTSGHSAVIQESAASPAILTTSGVVELTGDSSGVTLTVSDLSGKFNAAFDANGNIQWNFNEAKSDFASLQPGQVLSQTFDIILSTDSGTTTIPVRVSVIDADLPTVTVTDVAPVASPVNLAQGPENAPYTITAAALLAGVADIDSPSLSVTAVTIKSGGGALIDNGNGTWTYTPPAGFAGVVAFNYVASDGTLSASSTASLNLISPTVTSITAPTGDNGPGAVVSLTVNFSEAVTVDVSGGNPTLLLSNGATATYVSGNGANALLFHYTVGATGSGESIADLATAATNALTLNGGTIVDAAGNPAVLTGADNVNPAGTLQIDTTAPTVTTVTDNVAAPVTNGPISFTASFSEAVTGVSTGSFTATNGTVASVTAIDSSHYTILVNPTAGVASGNVGLSLVAGGATDTAGNAAVAANLSGLDSQGIDTLAPTAPTLALGTGVANGSTAAEATAAGGVVTVTGELNDSISVAFTNGIHTVTKTVTGTGSAQAVTLTATDLTTLTDGTISVSATQTDAAGNAQTVVAATTSFVLDTTAPTVTTVTDNVAAPVTNGPISFTASFSEAVTGVSTGSFTATNGTVASVTAIDSSHYTILVNPTTGVASGNVA